jgi:hypothetical protein
MRCRFLLNPEERAAIVLDHLDKAALRGTAGRQPQPRARGHDHIFPTTNQYGAAVDSGGDALARS